MTDHKFTDEEVIKALECCANGECDECHYQESSPCKEYLNNAALDLINRQKAEIERLKKYYFTHAYDECHNGAIKEFAERLKERATSICSGHGMSSDIVYVEYINKIAEEMMEEET